MLINIIIIFAVCGICISVWGLLFKSLSVQAVSDGRKSKPVKSLSNLLDRVTSPAVIKKPLDLLSSSKDIWINKLSSKILELSEIGINIQQLYFLKIICLIISAIIMLIIGYTNMEYRTKVMVKASVEKSVFYQESTKSEFSYLLYKKIIQAIGKGKLANSKPSYMYELVRAEIAEELKTSDTRLLEEKTEWFIENWNKAQNMRMFKYYHYAALLISIMTPEIILIVMWLLRGSVYKKEIIKLEYIFELLARVDGIKTTDIIKELEKSTRIYFKNLNEFGRLFKYDKKKGFNYLRNKNIKSLSRLINVMEVYCLTDKEIALQVLEREVMERDESLVITADETIDFIDLVAFLSIVPLVYELARLMLSPMLDIVYKAFEFI